MFTLGLCNSFLWDPWRSGPELDCRPLPAGAGTWGTRRLSAQYPDRAPRRGRGHWLASCSRWKPLSTSSWDVSWMRGWQQKQNFLLRILPPSGWKPSWRMNTPFLWRLPVSSPVYLRKLGVLFRKRSTLAFFSCPVFIQQLRKVTAKIWILLSCSI